MKKSFYIIIYIVILSQLFCQIQAITYADEPDIQFWVNPIYGSDNADGKQNSPFLTIEAAQNAASMVDMNGDIIIWLCPGTYRLTSPLNFTAVNSGKNGYNVIYRATENGKAVISGGKELKGWECVGNGIYKCDVQAIGDIHPSQLYVDEKPMRKASLDGTGFTYATLSEYQSEPFSSEDVSEAITIDLGKIQLVNELSISASNLSADDYAKGFPTEFAISVSEDDMYYETVKSVNVENTPKKGEKKVFSFNTSQCRYVKVNITKLGLGNDGGYRFMASEISAGFSGTPYEWNKTVAIGKGVNLAVGKKAYATSSFEYPGWGIQYINDGNTSSGFYSTEAHKSTDLSEEQIVFDLSEECLVGGIRLYPRLDSDGTNINYPNAVKIEASDDNTSYRTIMELGALPDTAGVAQEISFYKSEKTRYVRITPSIINKGESDVIYRAQFSEIEILDYSTYVFGANVNKAEGANLAPKTYYGDVYTTFAPKDGCDVATLSDSYTAENDVSAFYMDDCGLKLSHENIELWTLINWQSHMVKCVSKSDKYLIVDANMPSAFVSSMVTWAENSLQFITEENEWYYDSDNKELYLKTDELINNKKCVVPYTNSILSLTGSIDNPIHNIVFDGLTFEGCSDGLLNRSGYFDAQAGITVKNSMQNDISAAVKLSYAENVSFINGIFRNIGSGGIIISDYSKNNTVDGNVFCDISSTAIQIGGIYEHHSYETDSRMITRDNIVSNNYITRVGVDYFDCVGIFAPYAVNTIITHNEIHNLPYTGISVGWGWGSVDTDYERPASSYGNVISENKIYNCGRILHDGGLIYTLGAQKGTIIANNYMNGYSDMSDNKDVSLYLDEGSAYIEAYGNVIGGAYFWGSMWTGSIHDNNIHDNIYSGGSYRDFGTNNTSQNNVLDVDFSSEAAVAVIQNAGLKLEYANIKNKVAENSIDKFEVTYSRRSDGQSYYIERQPGYSSPKYNYSFVSGSIQMDLGETKTISTLELMPRHALTESGYAANYPISMKISFSEDGAAYTNEIKVSGNTTVKIGELQSVNFDPVTCRYVKLTSIKYGDRKYGESKYYMAFDSILAFGKEKADYSSYAYTSRASGKNVLFGNLGVLSDGDIDTVLEIQNEQTFEAELDGEYYVSDASLKGSALPDGFELYVSVDKETYNEVLSAYDCKPNATYSFPTKKARYVRLVIKASAENKISLGELELYESSPDLAYKKDTNLNNSVINDGNAVSCMNFDINEGLPTVITDMEVAHDINCIRIYSGVGSYPKELKISSSMNGVDYAEITHIYNIPDIGGKMFELRFNNTFSRFIKIDILDIGIAEDGILSLGEVEIFSAPLRIFTTENNFTDKSYIYEKIDAGKEEKAYEIDEFGDVAVKLKAIPGQRAIVAMSEKNSDGELQNIYLGKQISLDNNINIHIQNQKVQEVFIWSDLQNCMPVYEKIEIRRP